MKKRFDAIYEGGVLRPLEPLLFFDPEPVQVPVSQAAEEEWIDLELIDFCADDSDPSIPSGIFAKPKPRFVGRRPTR